MPITPSNCTVARTHDCGRPRRPGDWPSTPGPVLMWTEWNEQMRRNVRKLSIIRTTGGGGRLPSPIPDLIDPVLLTFGSDRGMMVVGFEEIDGARFYQGWHITW